MSKNKEPRAQMIPIDEIEILNPRMRDRWKFQQVIHSIEKLGLKIPIKVSPNTDTTIKKKYLLVYGQGRLEACKGLGFKEIAALVEPISKEECLLQGLVENLARKQYTNLELAQEIVALKDAGVGIDEIAKKTGLHKEYVRGIIRLFKRGERRLITAVVKGQISINIAVKIASANDADIQQALQEAHEKKELRGADMLRVRQLMEARRTRGKNTREGSHAPGKGVTAKSMIYAYKKETTRLQRLKQRARLAEAQLDFLVSAFKELFSDKQYVSLLRSEKLHTLPKYLAEKLQLKGVSHA